MDFLNEMSFYKVIGISKDEKVIACGFIYVGKQQASKAAGDEEAP